jgi:hypothetical protein
MDLWDVGSASHRLVKGCRRWNAWERPSLSALSAAPRETITASIRLSFDILSRSRRMNRSHAGSRVRRSSICFTLDPPPGTSIRQSFQPSQRASAHHEHRPGNSDRTRKPPRSLSVRRMHCPRLPRLTTGCQLSGSNLRGVRAMRGSVRSGDCCQC